MSTVFRAACLALVVTALAVAVGVLVKSPPTPAPAAPLATPLAAADTTAMTVRRASFCGAVARPQTAAALGSTVGALSPVTAYRPGQKVALTPKVSDIADEWGCSWSGAGGRSARVWLFAPPVTRARAEELAARVPKGCASVTAAAFGSPTAAATCGDTVSLRGLFGDAWLSCELTIPGLSPSRLLDRAGRWCLVVARAAG